MPSNLEIHHISLVRLPLGGCLRLTFLSVVVICLSSRMCILTRYRRGDRCRGRMTKFHVLVYQIVSKCTGSDCGSQMSSTDIDSIMGREAKFVINMNTCSPRASQTDH